MGYPVRDCDEPQPSATSTAWRDNDTPPPDGGGGFRSRRLGLRPAADASPGPPTSRPPWPQVWVEIAFTDSGRDYLKALDKIVNAGRDVEAPCAYVLIALQQNASRLFENRMALFDIDLTAPSVKAVATNEPQDAPKVAAWLPTTAAPSRYHVVRTNEHIDIPINSPVVSQGTFRKCGA